MGLNTLSSVGGAGPVVGRPARSDDNQSEDQVDSNRDVGEKLATQVDISNYSQITDLHDLKNLELSDDKHVRKHIQKTSAKLIKSIGLHEGRSFHLTGPFHADNVPNPEAKLVVNFDNSEDALKQYFKTGFFHSLWTFLPRLFGARDRGFGAKWLKAGSGMLIFDPSSSHSHADSLKLIREKLKSGRYTLSAVYKACPKGKFSKEPEALILVDTMNGVIDDIQENGPPEFQERAKNMSREGLDSFSMPNTLIVNPKHREHYNNDSPEDHDYRAQVLRSWAETHDHDANIIIPTELFKEKEAESKHHLFEKVKRMNFLYYDPKGHSIGLFGTNGTLIRGKNNKYKIPEQDLSTMITMAMISEHCHNVKKLPKKFKAKLEENLEVAISQNTAAFAELNHRLGFD